MHIAPTSHHPPIQTIGDIAMAHVPNAALASGKFLERTIAPTVNGSSRSMDTVDVPHRSVKKITCMGSGFVGGPTSAVIAYNNSDIEVTVVDINPDRVVAWKSSSLPIYEPGLYDIVRAARDGVPPGPQHDRNNPYAAPDKVPFVRRANLFFSTNVDQAIMDADLIFVCVNTPTKAHGIGKGSAADLDFVEAATRNIAKVAIQDKIVVEKSTVPCRTAQAIREILAANAHPGVRFDVLSNPEFLAEGTAVRDLLYPDRIIIGSMPTAAGYRAAATLAEVYGRWVPQERIITMNLWSSELSKLAANAMLAQRISSVNALSAICEATGADVDEVSYAYAKGSSCFQKDIFNIVYLSESLHLYEIADYWRAVINMNEHQKKRFTKRIISCLYNNLAGKKLAVLGFAFKKDTSDTRESPAITLVTNFVVERARVAIYDPHVPEHQIWCELTNNGSDPEMLKRNVAVCSTAYEACEAADAVVIMTEWDEFSNKSLPEVSANKEDRRPLSNLDVNSSTRAHASPKSADQEASRTLSRPDFDGAAAFQVPPRKGTGIVIKDPLNGEVKTFSSQRPSSGSSPLQSPTGHSVSFQSPPRPNPMLMSGRFTVHPAGTFFSPRHTSDQYLIDADFPHVRRTVPGTDLHYDKASSIDECLQSVGIGSTEAPSHRLDWARIASRMRRPMFVFDGRNILDHSKLEALGFRVEAIGKKGTVVSE
ncbi:MAG: hypothetical protein Q9182_003789 [Xanthomendoza sp. 2 TL-2023]